MSDNVTVNGVEYAEVQKADSEGRVLIRSRDSGVHYGTLVSRDGTEVVLSTSRRLWSWSGAASLSELATAGVANPDSCKFTVRLPSITVLGVCEVIPCTKEAVVSIEGVDEWKMQ